MNTLVENPYVQIRDMIAENLEKDVVLSEVNTLVDVYSEVERKIEAHTKAEIAQLSKEQTKGTELIEAKVTQAPTGGGGPILCGIGAWILVVFLGGASGIGSGLLSFFIIGPIVGVTVGAIVSHAGDSNRKRGNEDKQYELRREGREILDRAGRKEKAILNEHRSTLAAITAGRDHIKQNVKRQVQFINQRITDLKLTIDLNVEITVDANDDETRGKPRITWRSDNLEVDVEELISTDELGDISQIGAAKLIPFYNQGISFELKLYRNEGGLITEGDYNRNGVLIHHCDVEAKGEFLDQEPHAGATRNYYVVLETSYFLARPTKTEKYELGRRVEEHLIFSKRVTVPQFLSEADRLDQEISKNTTQLKREKYREQYQRTLKKISGDSADPDQALKDVLQAAKSRRSMEKKKQEYVAQIEAELTDIGANEEEIEEAIEAFYKSMET